MKPYCEIVVQVVLPGVRALVAKELMQTHKMTQQQTSQKLGVSQAAVSQYTREIRGYKIRILEKDQVVMKEVANIASRIASDDSIFDTNFEVISTLVFKYFHINF